LQPAREDLIERGSGDDSQLTEFGYRARQTPRGDARAHSALDDRRELIHPDALRPARRESCRRLADVAARFCLPLPPKDSHALH
jgi:hypothetical protein